MVEYYIHDKRQNQLLNNSLNRTCGLLVKPKKKSNIKFIRQRVYDQKYDSIILEKDNIMSHYHQILEKTLNSTISFQKEQEKNFKSQKKIWMSKSKPGSEVIQKYEEDLLKYLSPVVDRESVESPFNCEIFTLKFLHLLSAHRLQIPVPESVIYGHGFDSATYVFNDSKGVITFLPKQSKQHLELVSQILSSKRTLNDLFIGPVAIYRGFNSESNKLYMREKDLNNEFKSLSKKDVLIQRYILPKGSRCSKFRLVFRNNNTRVFSITNKCQFDKSEYSKRKKVTENDVQDDATIPSPEKLEPAKSRNKKILRHNSVSAFLREERFDSLHDFMSSISLENENADTEKIYYELFKIQGKVFNDGVSQLQEDMIAPKIFSKLRKMFCTYSKSNYYSYITELKFPKTCENLVSLFKYIRDIIDNLALREQSLKISEIICDFFEDKNKNLYFSQIKSCRCVKINYVPLRKIIKEKQKLKQFKCPGKYCLSYQHEEGLMESGESVFLIANSQVAKRYSVLRGTIDEKFIENDNIEQLNPRLFERIQVCKHCFKVYNELSNKNYKNCAKPHTANKKKRQSSELFIREPSYCADIGKKLRISQKCLSQNTMKQINEMKLISNTLFLKPSSKGLQNNIPIPN